MFVSCCNELHYVVREMTDANGGFYSSQDADSEGHKGKFFVWTPEEIRGVLGGSASGLLIVSKSKTDANEAQLVMDAFGVTLNGNFEGKTILHRPRDMDVLAAIHDTTVEDVERRLDSARQKLFNAREQRVKPARDEKILTGWNGLMLAAFAEAARVLKREDYLNIAKRNAEFLLTNLRDENGRLKRSFKDGKRA